MLHILEQHVRVSIHWTVRVGCVFGYLTFKSSLHKALNLF